MSKHIETKLVHAGTQPDPGTGAIMTPIYQTSTYVQKAPGDHQGYEYSRSDNPTRTALQKALAEIEGGQFGLAFASGLAATDTVLRLMKPGDHIIAGNDVYGGTYRLFEKVLARYGLSFDWLDMRDLEAVEAAIRPETRLIWLESPTNPMLRLADISAICELAPAGTLVAVDNTFATPVLQRPLELGADIVMHSTTKYLSGHSDVIGGAIIINDEAIYQELKFLQNAVGAVPAPMDCFLTLRGMKTLALRMERHCENALAVARMLEDHTRVTEVYYPGLESHPQHELAKQQMHGFGGMVSLLLDGDEASAREVVSRTEVFLLAESLGAVESLIEHPHSMTHASTADSHIATPANLIRLSVGIEHIEDLLADLKRALA
jgi:cystathionine beta-lyase/cystathionine gamma-synthase